MSLARIPFLSILGVPVAAAVVAVAGTSALEGQWQDVVSSHSATLHIDLSTACALVGTPDDLCAHVSSLGAPLAR